MPSILGSQNPHCGPVTVRAASLCTPNCWTSARNNIFDDSYIPEDELTEMTRANQETQRKADQQIESMAYQTGERLEETRKKSNKRKVR